MSTFIIPVTKGNDHVELTTLLPLQSNETRCHAIMSNYSKLILQVAKVIPKSFGIFCVFTSYSMLLYTINWMVDNYQYLNELSFIRSPFIEVENDFENMKLLESFEKLFHEIETGLDNSKDGRSGIFFCIHDGNIFQNDTESNLYFHQKINNARKKVFLYIGIPFPTKIDPNLSFETLETCEKYYVNTMIQNILKSIHVNNSMLILADERYMQYIQEICDTIYDHKQLIVENVLNILSTELNKPIRSVNISIGLNKISEYITKFCL